MSINFNPPAKKHESLLAKSKTEPPPAQSKIPESISALPSPSTDETPRPLPGRLLQQEVDLKIACALQIITDTTDANRTDSLAKIEALSKTFHPFAQLGQNTEFVAKWKTLTPDCQMHLLKRLSHFEETSPLNQKEFLKTLVELAVHFPKEAAALIQKGSITTLTLSRALPFFIWVNRIYCPTDAQNLAKHIQKAISKMVTPREQWMGNIAFRCFQKGKPEHGLALLNAYSFRSDLIPDLLFQAKEFPWESCAETSWAADMEAWVKENPSSPIPFRFLHFFFELENKPSRADQLKSLQASGITIAKLLGACKELCNSFPDLHPHFLEIAQHNPHLLILLSELQKKMPASDFSFFIEQHIVHLYKTDPMNENALTAPKLHELFQSILQQPQHLENFLKLVTFDHAQGTSLLVFFANPANYLSSSTMITSLVQNPSGGRSFSRLSQYAASPKTLLEPHVVPELEKRFKTHSKQVYELFELLQNHLDVCLLEVSYFANGEGLSINKYKELNDAGYLDGYCNLLRASKSHDFPTEIANSKNKELKQKLFKIANEGGADLIPHLWKFTKEGQDTIEQKLIKFSSQATVPIVRKILKLRADQDAPLLDYLKALPPHKIFTPETRHLLALHSQGNFPLLDAALKITAKSLDKRSAHDKIVLEWVCVGHYSLAQHLYEHQNDPFWKSLFSMPVNKNDKPDHAAFQKFLDLHTSLHAMKSNSTSWSEGTIQSLEQFAMLLYQHRGMAAASEWMAVLQFYLTLSPERVKTFISSRDFLRITAATDSATIKKQIDKLLENPFFSFHSPLLKFKDEKIPGNLLEHTRILAARLITPGGSINTSLIKLFLNTYPWKDKVENAHLEFILNVLKSDNYFSDRLAHVGIPSENSRQAQLIRDTIKKDPSKPLTANDARQAILSAMLWPLRQSMMVGSCFGTAVAIQQMSSVNGLKQVFEDFLSLINEGKLKRPALGETTLIEYPLSYDREEYQTIFRLDNPLARAREFTIAGMSDSLTDTQQWTKWNRLLDMEVESFVKATPLQERTQSGWHDTLENDLKHHLKLGFRTALVPRYFGYVQNGEGNAGAWVLVDRETNTSVIESSLAWKRGVLNSLKTFQATLSKAFPHLKQQLFDRLIPILEKNIGSDDFINGSSNISSKDLFAPSSNRWPSCPPFVNYQGGQLPSVLSRYSGTEKHVMTGKVLPEHPHPLGRVLRYVESLNAEDKIEAIRNSRYLKCIQVPGHGMNLCIGKLAAQIAQAGGADQLFKKWHEANTQLLNTPLTQELTASILKQFFLDPDLKAKRIEFEPRLKSISHNPLLKDLVQLLTSFAITAMGTKNAKGIAEKRLEEILAKTASLTLPPHFEILDSNWKIGDDGHFQTSFASSLDFGGDHYWPVNHWLIFESLVPSDDFSRFYYKKQRSA